MSGHSSPSLHRRLYRGLTGAFRDVAALSLFGGAFVLYAVVLAFRIRELPHTHSTGAAMLFGIYVAFLGAGVILLGAALVVAVTRVGFRPLTWYQRVIVGTALVGVVAIAVSVYAEAWAFTIGYVVGLSFLAYAYWGDTPVSRVIADLKAESEAVINRD